MDGDGCLKPTVHYTTFVGRMANGRLNTRNRIVYAYRQQTLAVVGPIQKMNRADWSYASVRAPPTQVGCNSVRITAFVADLFGSKCGQCSP